MSPFGARLRHLGPSKVPNSLENGPFWDRKRVKNGAKTRFPENDPGPFGVLKRDNCAYKQHSAKIIPEHYYYVLLKNVIYLANCNILPALYVGLNPGGRPEFIMGFFCTQPPCPISVPGILCAHIPCPVSQLGILCGGFCARKIGPVHKSPGRLTGLLLAGVHCFVTKAPRRTGWGLEFKQAAPLEGALAGPAVHCNSGGGGPSSRCQLGEGGSGKQARRGRPYFPVEIGPEQIFWGGKWVLNWICQIYV